MHPGNETLDGAHFVLLNNIELMITAGEAEERIEQYESVTRSQ